MKDLNKADFYFGAFYSYLITRKFKPVLIDKSDNSRHLSIYTNDREYNLFAMYISEPTGTSDNNTKPKFRWNFTFTGNLYNMFRQSEDKDKSNYVAFICGQRDLKNSEIILVDYKIVLKCLGADNINKTRNFTIIVQKNSSSASCYGTAIDKKDAIPVKRKISEYLK